jgi:membrane protease subunit (stomatin/prohibitin family)
MAFIHKNLLKVIEWKDNSKDTVVYKYPLDEKHVIMTGSTLVVREGQIAIFVHKGKIAHVFDPGTHRLITSNFPFLTELLSVATGFESPIKSDVYYINTKQFIGQKWGTQNPIPLRDKDFGVVRLRGYGVYSFRVIDGKAFMQEVFGTNDVYKTQDIAELIRPIVVRAITDTLAEGKISVFDLASNYKEFGEEIIKESEKDFAGYGIKIEKLIIENLSLPEEVEKAIDERSKLGVMEDKLSSYTKYKVATAIGESSQKNNGNGLVGLGVGMGLAGSIAKMISEENTIKKNKAKTCLKCGNEVSSSAKHCSECGVALGKTCPKCGEIVSPRAKYCQNCGEKLQTKKVCAVCGEEIKSSAKFCPNCGEKQS